MKKEVEKYEGEIKALKADLYNARKGLERETRNLHVALRRMLEYKGSIECKRNRLASLGILDVEEV